MYTYRTKGTCCRAINVEMNGDVVESVEFMGGCPGNTLGIAAVAKGKTVDELASIWEGIQCGFKPTSCPDQLVKALREAVAAQ